MDRKSFMRLCGSACLGLAGISLLESCTPTRYVHVTAVNGVLAVNAKEFVAGEGDKQKFRKYIVVRSDRLDHPVVLFRNEGTGYQAFLLECTHQGLELSVHGDIISCAGHGSEFSKSGKVITGPAIIDLHSFNVSESGDTILIQISS